MEDTISTCICVNRFLVENEIHDEFVHRLKAEAEKIVLGDGTKPGVTQGLLIDAKTPGFMRELLDDATAKGAAIVCGGKQPALGGGFFVMSGWLSTIKTKLLLMILIADEIPPQEIKNEFENF